MHVDGEAHEGVLDVGEACRVGRVRNLGRKGGARHGLEGFGGDHLNCGVGSGMMRVNSWVRAVNGLVGVMGLAV